MLILDNLKNEEIRNHLFSNFNPSYFVGHTMDVPRLSCRKLSLLLLAPEKPYYLVLK
jgi:hypothetical protein